MTSALPKFNSTKNPFRAKVTTQTLPLATRRVTVAAAAAPVVAPAPAPQPSPAPAPAPSKPQAPAAPGLMRRTLAAVRGQGAKVFAWLARPQAAAAKPAVPPVEKLPIQAELSLDRITVVRNDLSDADLEIVPRTPAAPAKGSASPAPQPEPVLVPAAAPAPSSSPKAGMARMAWSRASRLLGAAKA